MTKPEFPIFIFGHIGRSEDDASPTVTQTTVCPTVFIRDATASLNRSFLGVKTVEGGGGGGGTNSVQVQLGKQRGRIEAEMVFMTKQSTQFRCMS